MVSGVSVDGSMAGVPRRVLPLIACAVFLASTPWFAGTAAMPVLRERWALGPSGAASLTSATQWGFIAGTLLFALTNLADRFPAPRVFVVSALASAACNLGFGWLSDGLGAALAFRFLTGVALAGVYPVAMKIVASWFEAGLGWRLGVMVGGLTLGTAFPYLVAAVAPQVEVHTLISVASAAGLGGGLLMLFGVGEGPHLKARAPFDLRAAARPFGAPSFRRAALGYFGHMWELYAMWALVGSFAVASAEARGTPLTSSAASGIAFATVAAGAVGCVLGGLWSRWTGERTVALVALTGSGLLAALSPLVFGASTPWLVAFLLAWGVLVVADSAQFSALVARHAPRAYVGTALTVVNGLGFLITTASIQLVPAVAGASGWRTAMLVLVPGPVLGVLALRRLQPSTGGAGGAGE